MPTLSSPASRTIPSAKARIAPPAALRRDPVAEALSRVGGVASDFAWPSLTLEPGEDRVLSSARDGLPRLTLATEDPDEFKAWVGVDGLWVRAGVHASIQRHHPRLFLDVVTADTITIPRHARLILTGRPVLFAARRVDIRGGSFVSTVDGYYAIGVLDVRHPTKGSLA